MTMMKVIVIFITWIGSVTSVFVSSSNFHPLYYLLEDGHINGRNM